MDKQGKAMDGRLRQHNYGFFEVINKPSIEELKAYYAERYFQNSQANYRLVYSEEELSVIRQKIIQYDFVVESLRGSLGTGRILDVGCGEGFALAHFLKKGWHVEGIDFSEAGVLQMNAACHKYLQTGDIFELLSDRIQRNKQYDLIWLTNVLEHVLEPVDLLKQLRGLLSDNGVLVLSVPNDFSDLQETCLKDGDIDRRFWIGLPDHMSYFTVDSLKTTAHAVGYTCQRVLAEFPIDWFLLHPGSNYVMNPDNGPAAHRARIRIEGMLAQRSLKDVVAYYESMATLGMGRQIVAFLMRDGE